MRQAAVGCLIGLGGWMAVAAALSWLLQARLGVAPIDTLGVALLAGLAGWLALQLLHASVQAARERRAITGGMAGQAPRDRRRAVLVGTIEPLGPLLQAPLDGANCVAYDYQVGEDRGSGRQRRVMTHFKGVGLTPSVIVTPSGRHRLLAVPELQDVAPTPIAASDACAGFRRHARATPFSGPDTSARELVARWTDDDGAYRSDVAYAALDEVDLGRCTLSQRRVDAGAKVCAIGTYSAAHGGLVPSPSWASGARLIEGDPDQVLATLGASVRNRLWLALLAGTACAAGVAAYITHVGGR